ncbi:MAG: hypothetical protein A2Y62_21580 [Candidatus Fischerbacteria bacterium RBG_13_37_8]|uniref:Lysozyme n=1 Tax=Candidatus Fischerbacteria bacterium RBG_13_37_8 TaxID=1817863 RepID=A0A1F5VK53_9BACT|nr:MAG: hypothetical protein A2Y62_21580 [Candidatus Fischerbacteria bacterium RBG_13_37_8]
MIKKTFFVIIIFIFFMLYGLVLDGEQSHSILQTITIQNTGQAWMKGIDIYEKNVGFPSWQDMYNAGFRFVFHKASQYRVDNAFNSSPEYRWSGMRDAGLIRGAYHFYKHNAGTVQEQAQRYIDVVQRLVPGDLGPVMDVEDETPGQNATYWISTMHTFLDAVETALGRTPIIYTSERYWKEYVGNNNEFSEYPLWVVHNTTENQPALPAGWNDWTFWQWHTENSKTPMPYPFKQKDKGIDLNWFNGTIWQLRGYADLGKIAHYNLGINHYLAYADIDGHILLSSFIDLERTSDLHHHTPNAPLSAGDPAMGSINNLLFIAYRAMHNSHIYLIILNTLTRANIPPALIDLTETTGGDSAASDPIVQINHSQTNIMYWGNNNHNYRIWLEGTWHIADLTGESGSPDSAGNPVSYITGDIIHTISRTGRDGHLRDIWFENNTWHTQNILTDSRNQNGNSAPPATYTPAIYQPYHISTTYQRITEPIRIVYRAVRGQIWEIERDTLAATNLSDASSGAPAAAGSPDAYFLNGIPHIIYRDSEGRIHELYKPASTWRHRELNLSALAASDPRVCIIENTPYILFIEPGGQIIRESGIGNGKWAVISGGQALTSSQLTANII